MPSPLTTLVTKTCPALTFFGVEPSLIVTYFPKGRPPKAAFPRLVFRKYAAAFLAFFAATFFAAFLVDFLGATFFFAMGAFYGVGLGSGYNSPIIARRGARPRKRAGLFVRR